MKYQKLGTTNISVSEFALGCWPFAGGHLWGYQADSDSIDAVKTSIENGINFFDTAPGYGEGKSEEVLGKALQSNRKEVVITTKVSPNSLDKKGLIKSCEESLTRLRTDYVDLYQIHWPNPDIRIEETVEALIKLKKMGKIRSIGVSNFGIEDFKSISGLTEIVTNQLPYNGLWRAIEEEISNVCINNDTGIICYSTLAQGLLTGRYKNVDSVPDGVSRSKLFSQDRSPLCRHKEKGCENILFKVINSLIEYSNSIDVSLATFSLGWLKVQPGVQSMLIGARNKNEVELNIPAFNINLSEKDISFYKSITEPIKKHIKGDPDMWNEVSKYR